jgi:hypothetical protein
MRTFIKLFALSAALLSPVSSLPYIEHVDGEQGYYKDTSGRFVLDGTLSPTHHSHVILPTPKSTTRMPVYPPIPTSTNVAKNMRAYSSIADYDTTPNITRRADEHPPTVEAMVTWLKDKKKWNGRGTFCLVFSRELKTEHPDCVFYTTPTADESDAEEFAMHHFPGGGQGRWFQELFTNEKKEYMLDVWARKEWTDKHEEESDPLVLTRMCEALGEVSITLCTSL